MSAPLYGGATDDDPPSIMWLRDIERIGMPKLKNIRQIKRSNVVFHMNPILSPEAKERRLRLGVYVDKLCDEDMPGFVEPPDQLVRDASNTNPKNPFAHLLFDIHGFYGKLLLFEDKKRSGGDNMIRNGKYSQPEHFMLVVWFLTFTNRPWYAGIAVPNNVISAIFKRPIGIEIKHNEWAVASPKFPGISIISPFKGKNKAKCTPIIYVAYNAKEKIQKRSSVNFAGPRTAEDFLKNLVFVDDLSMRYPSKHKLSTLAPVDEEEDPVEYDDDIE